MKSLLCLLAAITFGVACGGGPKDGPTTPGGGGGSAAKPAAAGDVSLELPAVEIKGVIFEPEALGRPGMPLYAPKDKKLTIDRQKKIFEAEKNPVAKQAQAAVLATMLYEESKKKTGDEQTQLVTEARKALRDVAAVVKPKVDDVTLRLLGSYEIQLEDWAAAEKAWEELVTKLGPKDKEAPYNRAWWAYALLKQYKNTEALNVVKSETISEKQPELAYVTAWAKWRAGDDVGAWQAIVAAAAGWAGGGNKAALERDVLLFAGRSSTPLAQVMPQLFAIFNAKSQPGLQYEVLAKLGLQSYQYAGRWAEGVAVLDEAMKLAGATVPPNDKLAIRYYQGDFTVRLDQPEAASRYAKDAIAAMPACTKCTSKEKDDLIQGIYGIGRMFHLLYATANDIRYYQPAHDLYDATIPLLMDPAMRTQAKSDLEILQKTLKNTKVGTGTHEKQAISVLLQRHNQEIQACYEKTLAATPKVAGTITIDLESDATGEIKGASSEPKAGVADLSAVAGCVVTSAKQWKLPKRGMAGNTRIKLVYTLGPKKTPATTAAPAAPKKP